MKKLMFAAAIVAGAVALQSQAMESQIVGYYTTTELEAGTFYLMGMSFEGTDAQPISIQNAVQGAVSATKSVNSSKIYLPGEGGGWKQFWFQQDYFDEDANNGEGDEIPTWVWLNGGEAGNKANVTIDPGVGFWYLSPTKKTITIAGQVVQGNTKSLTLAAGTFTLCANPFPIELPLNDSSVFDWTKSGLAYQTKSVNSAKIYLAEVGGGWKQFWFQRDYFDEGANNGEGDEIPTWVWLNGDEAGNKANVSIKVGEGFWMLNPTATTVTFKK